jgi:hypothetical protein
MDDGLFIMRINLKNQFSTPSAWRQNPSATSYRNDLFYFRLPMFQHFGYRGMLGTKSNAATSVNADAGIDMPFLCDKRATYAATTRQLAQRSVFTDPIGLFAKRDKVIHE